MSTIRQAVRSRLAATASITAIVAQRIYLSRVPQSIPPLANYPCIVFRRATGGHTADLDGGGGYAAAVFEFHVLASDPSDVETLCEAIRQTMQGFRGTVNSDVEIQRLTLDDETDDYIETTIGDDVGFHRTILKYTIGYLESVPDPV